MTAQGRLTEAEVDDYAARLEELGYVIVEDAIPAALLADIRAELDRLEATRPGGDVAPAPFTGFKTRRWFDVLNDGDVWQKVATHQPVVSIVERALGSSFLLSTMGSAVIGPGEGAQPIHSDDEIYILDRPHRNLVCNSMWAISDFTEANGATRLVPGSNRYADYPDRTASEPTSYQTVPLEMPAGSVGLVLGTTYHGAGANLSDETRWGLTINYCNGSVRQQENYMLAIPPERLLTFDTALQDLLGFRISEGGCGHIFAGDPRPEMLRRYRASSDSPRPLAPRSASMS